MPIFMAQGALWINRQCVSDPEAGGPAVPRKWISSPAVMTDVFFPLSKSQRGTQEARGLPRLVYFRTELILALAPTVWAPPTPVPTHRALLLAEGPSTAHTPGRVAVTIAAGGGGPEGLASCGGVGDLGAPQKSPPRLQACWGLYGAGQGGAFTGRHPFLFGGRSGRFGRLRGDPWCRSESLEKGRSKLGSSGPCGLSLGQVSCPLCDGRWQVPPSASRGAATYLRLSAQKPLTCIP